MLHGGSVLFPPAPAVSSDERRLQSPGHVRVSGRKLSIRCAFNPAIPEQPPAPPPSSKPGSVWEPRPASAPSGASNAGSSVRTKEWRVYANGKWWKWWKHNESALSKSEALPLPMNYPGSTPDPEEVEKMINCNPELKDCKDVLYQWTGKCTRCQGTGEVSYFPKRGREVICKCISCLGLGYVQKMTIRTDVDVMEDLDGAL